MRKAILLIGVLALALGITYLVLRKSSPGGEKLEERDVPLLISSKTSAFNRAFATVLNNYYELCDGFVGSDNNQVTKAARKLSISIDSIRFDQFKADSSVVLTAMSLAQSIQGEIIGLVGETKSDQKKRELNMITDQLYSLIRTVRFDGSIVFQMRCTNAFPDSSEAYWLSPTNKIINPYFERNNQAGTNKMSADGEVSDSIHFSAPVSE